MLRRSIVCLVSLGVLIAGSAESVEDEVDYTREGPYLGFDGLVAIDTSNSVLDVDTTGGLAARIGFRMTPEIAVEIAGEWAYLEGRNPWSLLAVVKLYPFEFFEDNPLEVLGNRLQPFLVSSVGIIVGDFDRGGDPSATYRWGGGLDYWFTNDLALSWQTVYVVNSGYATKYSSVNMRLGVTWRY